METQTLAPEEGVRASSITDIAEMVREWDLYYRVNHRNLEEIVERFSERIVKKGHKFDTKQLVWRNKIKSIVNKRAESIPNWFDVDIPDNEAAMNWLTDWIKGRFFDGEHSLWKAKRNWNRMLERQGNVVLKLTRDDDGNVYVSRMNMEWADKIVNPEDYTQVLAWEFRFRTEGRGYGDAVDHHEIREYIDAYVMRRYEDEELVAEWDHNLGWIPVMHLTTNLRDDKLWGESVIEQLIDPQILMAAASSTLRACNRWSGWPAFAGTSSPDVVDLRPGGYSHDEENSLRVLSWNTDAQANENEEERYLQDMYEIGRVMPRFGQSQLDAARTGIGGMSGRALLVLSHDGIEYISSLVEDLEEQYAELLSKCAALAQQVQYDKERMPVTVSYPPLDLEDEETKRARAKLIIELYTRQLLSPHHVIDSMKNLNVVTLPEETETILAEAQARGTPEDDQQRLRQLLGEEE